MPLPRPRANEDRDTFLSRCISSPSIENEFDQHKTRVAVCMRIWEDKADKAAKDEREEHYVKITKKDQQHQIVKGVVYTAGDVDSDGETMLPDDVAKAAWEFLAHRKEKNIDLDHNWQESGCYVVESYFAEEGDSTFPANSWVMAVKCTDDIWAKVENGEINGFSFGGTVSKYPQRVLLEVEKQIVGITEENLNKDIIPAHKHNFTILFDKDGNILKGHTDVVELGEGGESHSHDIKYGTSTETNIGHSHRVSLE